MCQLLEAGACYLAYTGWEGLVWTLAPALAPAQKGVMRRDGGGRGVGGTAACAQLAGALVEMTPQDG